MKPNFSYEIKAEDLATYYKRRPAWIMSLVTPEMKRKHKINAKKYGRI